MFCFMCAVSHAHHEGEVPVEGGEVPEVLVCRERLAVEGCHRRLVHRRGQRRVHGHPRPATLTAPLAAVAASGGRQRRRWREAGEAHRGITRGSAAATATIAAAAAAAKDPDGRECPSEASGSGDRERGEGLLGLQVRHVPGAQRRVAKETRLGCLAMRDGGGRLAKRGSDSDGGVSIAADVAPSLTFCGSPRR